MTAPIVVCDVSGYTFAWEEEQIKITATGVRTHQSDGHISGVVRIETTAPGYKPLLHSAAQLNFMATRSRDELAKRLEKRFDHVDWYALLEKVCDEVIARTLLGEPLETINTADDIQPPPWLLKPLLIEGLPTVIFGDRGSTKSTLALAFAQVLQFGEKDNVLGLEPPAEVKNVLMLDWENSKAVVAWQAKKLRNGMLDGDYTQHYRHMTRPLMADIESVRRIIVQAQADVIIIDSLGPAAGGDLNATQPALDFFSALGQLHITSLILAHTAKNADMKTRSIFGSSFYENEARNIWEVRALQEAGDDTLEVGLFHRKPLPFYGKLAPFGYKLTFTPTSTSIVPHNPGDVPEFSTALGVNAQVLRVLRSCSPASRAEINNALPNILPTTIGSALSRLSDKGLIRNLPGKCYGLATHQETENA